MLSRGLLAGRFKDDPPPNFDSMIGEPLVEAAKQGDVDRGGNTVLPLPVHQHGEAVSVQFVHGVVVAADLCGLLRIAAEDHSFGARYRPAR